MKKLAIGNEKLDNIRLRRKVNQLRRKLNKLRSEEDFWRVRSDEAATRENVALDRAAAAEDALKDIQKSLTPHYSGEASTEFWKAINGLPEEMYSCGVLLQNMERSVLGWLSNALRDAAERKAT